MKKVPAGVKAIKAEWKEEADGSVTIFIPDPV